MKLRFLFVVAGLMVSPLPSFAEEPIEKLISQLGESKKDVHDEIVRRGESAVRPLAKVLQDEKVDNSIRIDAALLLGRIGGKNVIGPLKAALSDKNANVQFFAILALGDVGSGAADAVPVLAKLLQERAKDDDLSPGRQELIEALGKIGGNNKDAVDSLVACMKDRKCPEAALALTKFGEPGAEALVTLAAKYSKDDRPEKERRYGEVYLVVGWGMPPLPKEMIPVFKKYFEKGDLQERRVASHALAGVGPAAIPVLEKFLDDKNADLRAQAAESLAMMNWFAARAKERGEKVATPVSSDKFFPKLRQLYKLPGGEVDLRIIRAMMGIDHDRFMSDPELVKVLQDEFNKALKKQLNKQKD